jgi:hypothetical protein
MKVYLVIMLMAGEDLPVGYFAYANRAGANAKFEELRDDMELEEYDEHDVSRAAEGDGCGLLLVDLEVI